MTQVPIDCRRLNASPAQSPPIRAKQTLRDQIGLIDALALIFERGDIKGVRRTIKLAEETGLAIMEPSNCRNSARRSVKDVIRTSVDAGVAPNAASLADKLDHEAHAT